MDCQLSFNYYNKKMGRTGQIRQIHIYGVRKVLGHNNLLFNKKINKKYQIFYKYVLVEGSMFKFYSTN